MTRRQLLSLLAVLAVFALVAVIVRVSGGGGEEEEIVPNVAVHAATVGRVSLRRTVTAYGTVEPAPPMDGQPAAGAMITPFVDGVVSDVVMVEGRRVDRGTVLVRLDSRMARSALDRARSAADVARKAFERQEALLATDGTSQKAYLDARAQRDVAEAELAAAETRLAYLNIAAPLTGTVLRVQAVVGQHVDATSVLAEVVDLDRLVVTAAVPSREVVGLAEGQRVLLGTGDSVPEGTVRVLGRNVDRASGTYRLQASVPAGAGLMPGQFTQVRVVAGEHTGVLAVPEQSVISHPDQGTWIVVVEGDRAVHRPVTTGFRDRGLVEVSGAGLEEGMRVVTDEAYGLPSGTLIRVVR